MKIAIIGPTYPFRGGISHYTTLLYQHLCHRHTVEFFTFTRQYPKWLFPGKSDRDPSLAPLREENVRPLLDSMNPFTWIKTAKAISQFAPDLLIIPWWVAFWAPQFWTVSTLVRRSGKTKILFLCHNVAEHEANRLTHFLTAKVLGTGDYFIAQSEEDLQRLRNMLPHANMRKGFHPTYDVFNQGEFDADALRRRLGIIGKVILFFGFVREYKGLKFLIQAMPEILAQERVTLLVVGEFWKDKHEYMQLINELGLEDQIVIVDEYVPNEDVGNYFSLANLVVQPYLSATGSGVVQTAFGFNKPVVATKVGSLPEVVTHGETGYLVPPASAKALAAMTVKYFQEEKEREFSENIQKENDKFSWGKLVDLIEDQVSSGSNK